MPRFRYDADKGCEVPVETDEERVERERREERERKEAEWEAEERERARRISGPYL
jgi:hypothetical protein